MSHLPLFDGLTPPAEADLARRREVLSKLPEAPPEPRRVIPRALVDPCAHLEACPGCPDCELLKDDGFRRCSRCPRWSHQGCQYESPDGLICSGCQIAARGGLDDRDRRVVWEPRPVRLPAGTIKDAINGKPLPWEQDAKRPTRQEDTDA